VTIRDFFQKHKKKILATKLLNSSVPNTRRWDLCFYQLKKQEDALDYSLFNSLCIIQMTRSGAQCSLSRSIYKIGDISFSNLHYSPGSPCSRLFIRSVSRTNRFRTWSLACRAIQSTCECLMGTRTPGDCPPLSTHVPYSLLGAPTSNTSHFLLYTQTLLDFKLLFSSFWPMVRLELRGLPPTSQVLYMTECTPFFFWKSHVLFTLFEPIWSF